MGYWNNTKKLLTPKEENKIMVSLFRDPIHILDKISIDGKSEMTEWQLSFLCGLIKENKPEKILEIGVAAGGTTSVILNCISLLELQTELYSIDISKTLYTDVRKKTGFLAEQAKRYLKNTVNHKIYTGGLLLDFLQEIGDGIDFLILDTMHILPGELLDFLACFPFLKEGAVIVLHDIILHHTSYVTNAYATQLLLDCVVGEKIIGMDPSEKSGYPNIGAFKIIYDTKRYIENVFNALTLIWQYLPSEDQIKLYRNFYAKHYDDNCMMIFDRAVELNRETVMKMERGQHKSKLLEFDSIYHMIHRMKNYRVYIYGCGKFGKELKYIIENCGLNFAGYIVSDSIRRNNMDVKPYYLSEIEFKENEEIVLIGVNKAYHNEIQDCLKKYGINHYIIPDKMVCNFLGK